MSKAKVKTFDNFWERNKASGGYLLKKRVLSYALSFVRFILLFGMCFMILQPILNKISVSFMTEQDLATRSSGIFPFGFPPLSPVRSPSWEWAL